MPPKTNSDDFYSGTGREQRGDASDAGLIDDPHIHMLPTWNPDAAHRDAEIAKIAAAVTDGEHTAIQDGSNPAKLEARSRVSFASAVELHCGLGADRPLED